MVVNFLLIKTLPKFILDIFNNDIAELFKNTTILDNNIAEGLVYKIHVEGVLEQDGYESGFLYLTKGSRIKEHAHTDDFERYILVSGELKMNGNFMLQNECSNGETHLIDPVPVDTIICTYKQKQKVKRM